MRSMAAFLSVLLSVLIFPVPAHASGIYTFNFVGPHTINYSLPDDATVPNHSLFNFFMEIAPTSYDGGSRFDGVSLYYVAGALGFGLILDTPVSFGADRLDFLGSGHYVTMEYAYPPISPQVPPDELLPVFIPGTYQFQAIAYPHTTYQSLGSYTLTITHDTSPAATPEPCSLSLLALGALGLVYLFHTGRLSIERAS
jgi:hypothetical protein